MANSHLRVLYPAIMGIVNYKSLLSDFRHSTPFGTDQRDCFQSVIVGPLERLHTIRRVSTDTEAEHHVPGSSIVLQLSNEGVFERIIIGQSQHPTEIIVQRHYSKSFAH